MVGNMKVIIILLIIAAVICAIIGFVQEKRWFDKFFDDI